MVGENDNRAGPYHEGELEPFLDGFSMNLIG